MADVKEQTQYFDTTAPLSLTARGQLQRTEYVFPSFLTQLKEISTSYSRFLFIPGKTDKVLIDRAFRIERTRSKRKFVTKLLNPLSFLGLCIIFLITTWAVFPQWSSIFNYNDVSGVFTSIPAWSQPSPDHPLGTQKFGRDILGRLIWGARTSLSLGLFSLIISVICGTLVGLYAAYTGGWIDNIIMRVIDIIMAFPGLIMVLVIISIYGTSMQTILLVYGVLGIPGFARLIRGNVLQEKEKTYVEAARVSGASKSQIMLKHILPNCLAPIIVAFTFGIGGNILALAGLSFLGFTDGSTVEWGQDIDFARERIYSCPLAGFTPGFGILITVLGFMLVGDALRDAFDPRLSGKK